MIAAIQIAAFQMKWRRFQLAPRRPYSSENPLSNHGHTSSIACGTGINCERVFRKAFQGLRVVMTASPFGHGASSRQRLM
ncbi:hypothetical protein [Bradyrhizobium genosp. P]|uniref:hypothetical protein n=1 Tax=Bradyrhizobium genosp. P TaxID=83641 RepID=UPI003CEE54DB